MTDYAVRLSEPAIADLMALRRWITSEAGEDIAEAYLARLTNRFRTLGLYPEKGTPRSQNALGFRSVTFERKRIIFYRIIGSEVWIERVVDASRDLGNLL